MKAEELKKRCSLLAEELDNLINWGDKEVLQAIEEMILRTHPTLQQSFWRIIRELAITYSQKGRVDLRNEGAVNFCKKITEIKEVCLPFV